MRTADLARIDLNLLVILHTLLETRSATKTAERLGTSQPAVSRALNKLRRLFGDKLMVKGARGMMPTVRAEALSAPLARLLTNVEDFLVKPQFDPAVSDRVFRVASTDYGALAVLPSLMASFSREAPRAALEVVAFSEDVFGALSDGQIDMLLYADRPVRGSFRTRELFQESFVSLVRRKHPILNERRTGEVSLKQFTSWPHILVSIFGGATGPVDNALAAKGLTRHVALWVPYFATAAVITAASDFIVTMPSRVARRLGPHLNLVELRTPALIKPYGYRLLWHERTDGDLGAAWLRKLFFDCVATKGASSDFGSKHHRGSATHVAAR